MSRTVYGVVVAALLFAATADAQTLSLTKRADRPTASMGDVIEYTIVLENSTSDNVDSPVFIEDIPNRGITISRDQIRGKQQVGAQTTNFGPEILSLVNPNSDRLVRFGPFSMPARSTLTLRYQAVVGIDTRPGRYDNRAIAQGPGGVRLSNSAIARVVVTADSAFSRSIIVGRVMCKNDGDRGVPGARIVLDNGSYAVTDSLGRYHFSNVRPGGHAAKIDVDSVPGLRTDQPSRYVLLGEGVPGVVDFAVDCNDVRVTSAHATAVWLRRIRRIPGQVAAPTGNQRFSMSGSVDEPFVVVVNGVTQSFPNPAVAIGARAASSVEFATTVKQGSPRSIKRWRIDVRNPSTGNLVRKISGVGVVPATVSWDGRHESGTAFDVNTPFTVQLVVWVDDKTSAASAIAVAGATAKGKSQQVWPASKLFTGSFRTLQLSPSGQGWVKQLSASLRPGDRVKFEVHAAGGDALAALAATKKEANLLSAALGALVNNLAIEAKGRGAMRPLDRAGTSEATQKNRRVVVSIVRAKQAVATPSRAPIVMVNGGAVNVSDDGHWTSQVSGRTESVTLDVHGADGRRLHFELKTGERPSASAPQGELRVSGDVGSGQVTIGETSVTVDWKDVDALLVDSGVEVEEREGLLALKRPLVFAASFGSAGWETWTLILSDVRGNEVARHRGPGAPQQIQWDGRDKGRFVLEVGKTYHYRVNAERAGVNVTSPNRAFSVAGGRGGAALEGSLFTRTGKLTTTAKNRLSRIASSLARSTTPVVIEVARVPKAGASSIDARLAASVSAARVRKYMALLGIKKSRLKVRGISGVARDTIRFSSSSSKVAMPAKPDPSATIAGQQVIISNGKFEGAVKTRADEVVVEWIAQSGHTVEVRARVPAITAPAEPPTVASTAGESSGTAAKNTTEPELFSVFLPPSGSSIKGDSLVVHGLIRRGSTMRVAGRAIVAHGTGDWRRFTTRVRLAIGKVTNISLAATSATGDRVELVWPVRATGESSVFLAFAEGLASTTGSADGLVGDRAVLPSMVSSTAFAAGPFVLHGRVAMYLKARYRDTWAGDDVRVTAHLDTARERETSSFFEQLVDPTRDTPLFGDSAEEVRDANTRGPLYVHVKADDSSVTLGSIRTGIGDGELFQYRRTVDGALVHLQKNWDDNQIKVRAFAADQDQEVSADVDLFRSTGGSLYYLRNGYVMEGSEIIRVIVRGRDSGLVVSDTTLARNRDYTIEYTTGRILLQQPVPSTRQSDWLLGNSLAAIAPMSGDPVYVEIRYEHRGAASKDGWAGGVYGRGTLSGAFSVGAGIASQRRDGGSDYSIWGVDARAVLGAESVITAEFASAKDRDMGNWLSMDGGLSFQDLNGEAVSNNTDPNESKFGIRATAKLRMSELLGRYQIPEKDQTWFDRMRISGWVQDIEVGFAGVDRVAEHGRLKFGGSITQPLGEHHAVTVRHIGEVMKLPRVGPTAADVGIVADQSRLDEMAWHSTTFQWRGKTHGYSHTLELGRQRISSTAALADGSQAVDAERIGAAFQLSRAVGDHLVARAGQQVSLALRDEDPQYNPISPMNSSMRNSDDLYGVVTNIGADWKVADSVTVTGDYFQRWNGDNALQAGIRSALGLGSFYVRQRVGTRAERPVSTTAIGASDKLGDHGRSYGEYQLEQGIFGARNRALLGLGHSWKPWRGVGVSAGLEHQQAFGGFLPDGTPVGDNQRDVLYTAIDYFRQKNLRLTLKNEIRFDRGTDEVGIAALLRADPRVFTPAMTFPQHGGVAPGAPLFMQPGNRLQWILGFGGDYRAPWGNTVFARVRFANSLRTDPVAFDSEDDFSSAYYLESVLGWAFRPEQVKWLSVIARYSYLFNYRPSQAPDTGLESTAHILSVSAVANMPGGFVVAPKLAAKYSRAMVRFQGDAIDSDVTSFLAAVRGGYTFYKGFDVSFEPRVLTVVDDESTEARVGALTELGYTFKRLLRMGVGYNFRKLTDDGVGDLDAVAHGLFVRVSGQY